MLKKRTPSEQGVSSCKRIYLTTVLTDPYSIDMTTAAQQKRFDGVKAITALALDEDNGFQVRPEISVGKVVKAIRDLHKLGRTDRWFHALNRWESMILECDDYEKQSEEWKRHMHWAIMQGNVYAGHAAI